MPLRYSPWAGRVGGDVILYACQKQKVPSQDAKGRGLRPLDSRWALSQDFFFALFSLCNGKCPSITWRWLSCLKWVAFLRKKNCMEFAEQCPSSATQVAPELCLFICANGLILPANSPLRTPNRRASLVPYGPLWVFLCAHYHPRLKATQRPSEGTENSRTFILPWADCHNIPTGREGVPQDP